MSKRKQYGFTLIEVLAVVVILGIISGVAVAGYSTYIKKARNNYYKTQEDMLTQAGRDFFTDNRGKLPQATGEESCVLLSTLVGNKYIDPILDYNKKSCSEERSKVCARKLSTKKYLYYSYLDCGGAYTTIEYEEPTISFSLVKDSTAQNEDNDDYPLTMTISDEANSSKNNAGIASYRYVIYRKDKNNLVYYDSMWKSYKDQTKIERTVTINLDSSGTYYVRGWAYNRGGKLVTGISGEVTLNYTLDCQNQIEFDDFDYDGNWSNEDIDVNISKKGAVESFDVKLETQTSTYIKNSTDIVTNHNTRKKLTTIKDNGINVLKVTCHDSLGNTGEATSTNYKIDKVSPGCYQVNRNPNMGASESDWSKSALTLTAVCQDTTEKDASNYVSGCKQSTVSATLTSSSKIPQYGIDIVDRAGNSSTCKTGVYIDKEGPKITLKLYDTANPAANPLNTFTNQNEDLTNNPLDFAQIRLSITDDYSDIASYTMRYSTSAPNSSQILEKNGTSSLTDSITYSNPGTFKIDVTAQDKAGNISTAQLKVKVEKKDEDTTKPDKPDKPEVTVKCVKKTSCTNVTKMPSSSIDSYTSGTWTKYCVFCGVTESKGTITSQKCGAMVDLSLADCKGPTNVSYQNINVSGRSRVVFQATIGTLSATSRYIVNVDRKNPTLTVKMTKRDNIDYKPSSDDETYTNNTWSKKYVTLFATTKDSDSGVKSGYPKYYIKPGSATGSGTDTQGKWRSGSQRIVNAEGISYVKFKTKDNVDHSKETNYYTIKLDHSKPTLSASVSNNKISFKASDKISGIKDYCIKPENGNCSADNGYVSVTNTAGKDFSKSGITKITTSAKTVLKPGTKYTVVVRDQAGNTTSKTVSLGKTFADVSPLKIGKYATIGNGPNSSSKLYNEVMSVTNKNSGTGYNNCWNCNTNSWKNTNNQYVTADISIAKGSSDKKIKIQLNLANNVGTYLMASSDASYIRKICFTTGRTYSTSKCYNGNEVIKGSSDAWTNGTKVSKELDIPQKEGDYAIKIYSDKCNTNCNPYQKNGSCSGYMCSGIATFQTDYVIRVN